MKSTLLNGIGYAYGCYYCPKHFIIKEERDEHESKEHKLDTSKIMYEALKEIPELEDK